MKSQLMYSKHYLLESLGFVPKPVSVSYFFLFLKEHVSPVCQLTMFAVFGLT